MKTAIILYLAALIVFSGCDKNGIGFIEEKQPEYPAQLNSEWEYSTQMITDHLDSLGGISHSETLDLHNTIVKVAGVNETVGMFSGLTRFESHDLSQGGFTNKMWYMNNDSGLSAVAYHNPGVSQTVHPKASLENRVINLELLKTLSLQPMEFFAAGINSDDSIQYYNPHRFVLKYPMQVGREWIELQNPFFRKRIITSQEYLQTDIGTVLCYKVEAEMPSWKVELIDYISKEYGLMKREIIADSMRIATLENPDGTGWVNSRTVSVIKRADIQR